jgi:proline dehydrogenase
MGLFTRMIVAALPLVPKPIVGYVAKPYVAGAKLEDAIASIRQLNKDRACATLDILGESVTDRAKALAFTAQYKGLFDTIAQEKLDSNVSVKPTMLGLNIDEAFCRENIESLAAAAKEHGNTLCIDMEDRSTTDFTLKLYKDLLAKYGSVTTVIQARMRRTLSDIGALPVEGASVRLCKGIYLEPREAAWTEYHTIRRAYVAALEKMLKQGVYAAIATHDEFLIQEALRLIDRYSVAPDMFEFQMLLGVQPELRKILLSLGHRLRVYVPYGTEWYAYSTRRLRENPDVAIHVMRAFFGLR